MHNVTISTQVASHAATATSGLSLAPLAPSIATGPGLELEIPASVRPWHVGLWLALLTAGVMAALADVRFGWLQSLSDISPPIAQSSPVLLLLALGCEFMDATIGMGYGTTLTPILLVLGYPVGIVVPAALLSQLLANISVTFFHHQTGNFHFWNDRQTRNTGLIMGLVGLAVSVATMLFALKLPDKYLRTGITLIVIGIGAFMLVGSRFKIRFRMRNVGILAGVAAFNKAFSGGGYGPLVCGGQVLLGLPVRASVASGCGRGHCLCGSGGHLLCQRQNDSPVPSAAVGGRIAPEYSSIRCDAQPPSANDGQEADGRGDPAVGGICLVARQRNLSIA